ncbi:MAG: heavy-metal-associated domain-containing protein [Ardenticatenaceae bacterium]|nr:heavy-metal-associated domain-containing protein [Ardenticatenaceae bacterium]
MNTKTVNVPNISCEHCAKLIDMEVRELGGVSDVQISIPEKKVTISWDAPADWEKISTLLEEIEYPAAE